MEKFTVDLDKVLDEFEFNEEQAVRHALQHFKREDLPATKYQKPHFRPINIAEADFGPCIETTMSYSPYHHKHSIDSTNSLVNPDSASHNFKINNDVNHPVVSELIQPPIVNNFHSEKLDSNQFSNSEDDKVIVFKDEVVEKENVKDSHKEISINPSSVAENNVEKFEALKEVLEDVKAVELKQNDILESEMNKNVEEEVKKILMEAEVKREKINEVEKEIKDQESTKHAEGEGVQMVEEEKRPKVEDVKEKKIEEEEIKNINEEGEVKEQVDENKTKHFTGEENRVSIKEEEKSRCLEKEEENRRQIEEEERNKRIQEEIRKQMEEQEKNKQLEEEKKRQEEEELSKRKQSETELKNKTVVQTVKEPVTNSDLSKNESFSNNVEKEVKDTKLPDVKETNQEKPNADETIKNKSLDLVQNDKKPIEDNKCDSQYKHTNNTDEGSQSKSSSTSTERVPVVEPEIIKEEIKPIQFESQIDITDEELQRYLEELEEEEEEENRRLEAKSKPVRPDSLNLNNGESSGAGSPGLTPLPRNGEGVEGVGLEEENVRNENKERATEGTKAGGTETTEPLEETEESSAVPRSTEPPLTIDERRLGKVSPFWMPDNLASSCMECDSKFTVIKRRHHCRACGRILCSKCCGMRASLEYLQNQEQKVCETCFRTLAKVMMYELQNESESESSPRRRPNPNNPMEYCSTVPPPLQVSSSSTQPPPSVLVPVGVLKREGSSKIKETPKQVMFSDGIRPGGDLTELDGSGDHRNTFRKPSRGTKRAGTPPGNSSLSPSIILPPIDPVSQSFIIEKSLPPVCIVNKGETTYEENWPLSKIMEILRDPNSPPIQFAINRNLVASVKIVKLDCCMKETCWVICSKGMGCVGQDEIIVILALNGEEDDQLPKEVLLQFHYIYQEASKGNTVNELGYWCVKESTFLDSKQHGGFLFIRPTFQCLNRIEIPSPPFLVGVLIHRSEIPWARVFPFRLMLRLGAEFRYYPCPLVSVRHREPVYYEIGHTIINLLADFRNLSYTIPSVRGLLIHMEANQTSILIPRNRYDQVIRALNNSNDPVLALAGNFSPEADAHLVCMQSKGNEITYSTHAININDKPRKVTGASFVVLNGALKTTSGVAAKSSIVEDGLMVQVPSDTMTALRTKLRNMEDWSVRCGPIEGRNAEEVVRIIWCEDDKNFNIGVKSVIDNMPLDGVPSIRVHSGKDYLGCTKFIRWTQVFIIKCEDGATSAKIGDPLEVNKLSENIARATCVALTKLLELLAVSGLTVLAVRATIDQDNVGYEAGSNGEKLAPIYMNSLDNELIPVLHKAASVNDSVAVLELIFHIMDQ